MTIIRYYTALPKAHLDKSLLEAHEIPVEIRNESSYLTADWGIRAASNLCIAVPDQFADAALELIGRPSEESRKTVESIHRSIKARLFALFIATSIVGASCGASKGFKERWLSHRLELRCSLWDLCLRLRWRSNLKLNRSCEFSSL